jgi:DNA-directed RNA polymerase beta subunit
METNIFCAHGSSFILKERLMDVSDKFKTQVCNNCGFIMRNKDSICTRCKNSKLVNTVLPYSFKLLSQELMAFNIASRIRFK